MKNAISMLTIKQHHSASARARKAKHRGQALVETALVITVLLFLSMGLIQFALIANARATMTNLSREGARYAAVHALESGSDTAIKNYVVTVADATPLSAVVANDVSVFPPFGNVLRKSSNSITVTVTYDMRKKFILPTTFPGLSRFGTSTSSTAIMVIE